MVGSSPLLTDWPVTLRGISRALKVLSQSRGGGGGGRGGGGRGVFVNGSGEQPADGRTEWIKKVYGNSMVSVNTEKMPSAVNIAHSQNPNKKIKLLRKINNPTIDSLRSAASKTNESSTSLMQKYQVCVKQAEEIKPKNVFKKSTTFLLESRNYQIQIIATDSPTSLQNELGKKAQQFRRSHPEWPLNETLVAIFLQRLDATDEKETKCFCLDMPAFLHAFHDPKFLTSYINNIAHILSHSWNKVNSKSSKADVRSENEIPIFLDFRSTGLIKPIMHHLALAGTTFNHTLMTQNDPTDVICLPENIYFQLRYQNSNNKTKQGMAILSKDEWIDFISNPQFREFYNEVWEFLPLTDQYSKDRWEYFSTLDEEGLMLINALDYDMEISHSEEADEGRPVEREEEEEDEPPPKRVKIEE